MPQELLFYASLSCVALALLIALLKLLAHKRNHALWIMTGGVYLALVLLFMRKIQLTDGHVDIYSLLISADYSLDVFSLSYHFDRLPEFLLPGTEYNYQAYAAILFVLAPVLTLSNVLAFFQNTIDRLRYLVVPGKKYILSELNAEAIALAESIRKEHPYAQIVFTGVGNPEKKHDTKLLERARELGALCMKKDVAHLCYKFPLRTNLIFLISRHEPENVADALALIEQYKNSSCKMDIYVYASLPESKLAIDAADKGNRCLNPKFRTYLQQHMSRLLQDGAAKNWSKFAHILKDAPLDGRFTVRCVDVAEQTVLNVLKAHYSTIHNQAKETDRVVGITILGFGKHGAALLKNAAWIFQFYGYRLQFNIFDLDGSARKYLQQEAPMLQFDYSKAYTDDSSHDILFMGEDHGIDCLSSDFDNLILKTYWDRMKSTQLVFVSLGDDSKNIAASIHIRQLFQRKDMETTLKETVFTGTDAENEEILKNLKKKYDNPDSAASPLIFAVVNDPHRAENLKTIINAKAADQAQCNYHITPVATLRRAYHIENLQKLQNTEKAALKNHLYWSFKSAMDPDVTQLDEDTLHSMVENAEKYVKYSYYRNSSVATSIHQELLREVNDELLAIADAENSPVTEIKKITEKMRWNAYMRALGYQHLNVRNDRVKFHHLLKPYHLLPPQEKEKDLIEF